MSKNQQFRTAYDKSIPHKLKFKKPSITKQSHKDETDINKLLSNYNKTGLITSTMRSPQYYDLNEIPDFHQASNLLLEAQNNFDLLPAALRKKFSNDPAKFIKFCSDPDNQNELYELGLADHPAINETPVLPAETNPPESSPQPTSSKV